MTSRRILLALLAPLAVLVALLLAAPAQAGKAGPREVPALEAAAAPAGTVVVDTTSDIGSTGVALGAAVERSAPGRSAAKESAGLSALVVLMLVLIVAGTAVVGSRKSSR